METNYPTFKITTPENFQKVELPGFRAWHDALMLNPPQAYGTLMNIIDGTKHYCCLAILSKTQGRLREGKQSAYDGESEGTLSDRNPLHETLSCCGVFPHGCNVISSSELTASSFAGLNDNLQLSMTEIAEVLDFLYTEPVSNKFSTK